ncbi:MAG: MBL fold metallo-hydrolase [Candidatus Freyarchaeota archaeon]|nr:MBL fold metallo-hydrolase [Candidatus Jordarchaeia archaeon]
MELMFLGGCQTVGGSGLLISNGETNILVDYGVYMGKKDDPIPELPPEDVDAVFLTHVHLDHAGGAPALYAGSYPDGPPVYVTPPTQSLLPLLIDDMLKIKKLPFGKKEENRMLRKAQIMNYGDTVKINGIIVEIVNSGHVPGAYSTIIKADGKCVFYTSDFNTSQTRLVKSANFNGLKPDVVVMESTYALKEHPERSQTEREFVNAVLNVVEGGGVVLIPAFAVARSQEILCVLEKYNVECSITLDGMARDASRLLLQHPDYLKDYEALLRALSKCRWVRGFHDRVEAASRPGVIISTAGMLKGGPTIHYMRMLAKDSENAIFLVSFQIPGTPGRMLLDTGYFPLYGKPERVNAQIKFFNFSSHADRKMLHSLVESVSKRSTTFFTVHGEKDACRTLAEEIEENYGNQAINPNVGETYTL